MVHVSADSEGVTRRYAGFRGLCHRRSIVGPWQAGETHQDRPPGAIKLAKLHRASELIPVWARDEPHEAIRDPYGLRRCAACGKPASNCPASSSAMAVIIAAPPGPWRNRSRIADLKFDQSVHYVVL
jgi:hypothetical protein